MAQKMADLVHHNEHNEMINPSTRPVVVPVSNGAQGFLRRNTCMPFNACVRTASKFFGIARPSAARVSRTSFWIARRPMPGPPSRARIAAGIITRSTLECGRSRRRGGHRGRRSSPFLFQTTLQPNNLIDLTGWFYFFYFRFSSLR